MTTPLLMFAGWTLLAFLTGLRWDRWRHRERFVTCYGGSMDGDQVTVGSGRLLIGHEVYQLVMHRGEEKLVHLPSLQLGDLHVYPPKPWDER